MLWEDIRIKNDVTAGKHLIVAHHEKAVAALIGPEAQVGVGQWSQGIGGKGGARTLIFGRR